MGRSTYFASAIDHVRGPAILFAVSTVAAALVACTQSPEPHHVPGTDLPPEFAGSRLVAVSDADMLAMTVLMARRPIAWSLGRRPR